MKKYYGIIILIIVVSLFGWQLYNRIFSSGGDFGPGRGSSAVAVEVSPVRIAAINDEGSFTGSLLPRAQYTVVPKVTGRLEKIFVNIGDEVKYNQLIALLEDEEYFQQVERAQAELEVAKATVVEASTSFEVAEREFERAKILQDKKIGSESELDNAHARYKAQEANYKVSHAQVAQREASLKEAKVRLSYTKIHATWEEESKDNKNRVVGERFVYEGAMLTPNTPIVTILDINTVIAVIYVIERDYPKVKAGMEAIIETDAFPSRVFKGKITRIAPILKESSREARVEIEIPNGDHVLKPGMFVRVQIIFSTKDNATVVPISSLANRENKQGIFLADTNEMKVRFVPVSVGIVNGELVEINDPSISGLVVTLGQHLLEDGSSISISNEQF